MAKEKKHRESSGEISESVSSGSEINGINGNSGVKQRNGVMKMAIINKVSVMKNNGEYQRRRASETCIRGSENKRNMAAAKWRKRKK